MRKVVLDFLRRGMMASGIGPMVLAALYLILRQTGHVETLAIDQVCVGIFSITALAFVAGGMNAVYQIERLPLMGAILIHGGVLYLSYLVTYLVNDWMEWGSAPVLIFTGVFLVGYVLIWAVIYSVTKRNTEAVNQLLKQKQQTSKEC